jgi:cytochrome bd ubiquinol oxidase subunit I
LTPTAGDIVFLGNSAGDETRPNRADAYSSARMVWSIAVAFDPVFLSRLQFGFVITFHIIFPSFTIGLGAWLATIEGARLATGNPVYRRVFDFWLKIFSLSFGMGVVTGIVMAFQFGTNWSVLAERTGSIQGPLLGYEAFTAFMLEATFFGVMLLGRDRVSPRVYFFACCMVSLGTMFSSFWILANNSWMQVPTGHTIIDGKIIPADWREIVLGPIQLVRWPHMLLAAFLTSAMSISATGAWYLLRGKHRNEGLVMLHWSLALAAVLIPIQLFFGHLTGEYVLNHQPAKFAAIEARWKNQQPASEVLMALPDPWGEQNLFALEVPHLGSLIASGSWTAPEVGLESFPPEDRPPVIIPFFAFRIMVGMGLLMLAISWGGNLLRFRGRLETTRWFLWGAFLSFPTGFIAVIAGWYTAEVGRQPWVVYGLLRTTEAVTPSLTTHEVALSLAGYILVYALFIAFGTFYIFKLLLQGPTAPATANPSATPSRPLAFADDAASATGNQIAAGE